MNFLFKYQRGLTLISMLLILGLIAFFTLLVLKIAPIYIDHSKVVNSLNGLKETENIQLKSKEEVWRSLETRMDFNYVSGVTRDDVTIIKDGGNMSVQIDYEVVQPIMGNLSVLVEFSDEIEVSSE